MQAISHGETLAYKIRQNVCQILNSFLFHKKNSSSILYLDRCSYYSLSGMNNSRALIHTTGHLAAVIYNSFLWVEMEAIVLPAVKWPLTLYTTVPMNQVAQVTSQIYYVTAWAADKKPSDSPMFPKKVCNTATLYKPHINYLPCVFLESCVAFETYLNTSLFLSIFYKILYVLFFLCGRTLIFITTCPSLQWIIFMFIAVFPL